MKAVLLSFISLLAVMSAAHAETTPDSLKLHFKQSHINIDPTFDENRIELDKLHKLFQDSDDSARIVLKHLSVKGAASPEGTIPFNKYLSINRGKAILDYASQFRNIPDSIVDVTFTGRDWVGLRELVANDPSVPFRSETLATIDEIINSANKDEDNINRIKQLRNGAPYAYMYRKLFPELRYSLINCTWALPYITPMDESVIIPVAPALESIPGIVFVQYHSDIVSDSRPFYMALKTNLISDALALPNIAAEFYLGRNISIVGNWTYGWWDKDSSHRYWRAYGGDIALRWWFGKAAHAKPLTGHHLGVYGGAMTYDFEFGGKGYMGGKPGGSLWDRCNVYAGIEYGYSLPVAKRLNIDFTLGIGYLGGKYYEYIPKNGCYVWQSTHNLRWFGPTKAEISLTWLIGHGNINSKKGGNL